MLPRLIFFIAAVCLLSSCEKDEKALVLPPPTGAKHASVDMVYKDGYYQRQVFFDFDADTVVFTSDWTSWDLAFDASPGGRHVFVNNGSGVSVFNMHNNDMQVTELPSTLSPDAWQFDASCGLPDSTAIGEWCGADGKTKNEVYIIQAPKGTYQKLRILASDAGGYTIEWAPLDDKGTPATVHLAKDSAYNYIYFSFTKGIVNPEPPKNTWDVVFTCYRPLVYDNSTQQYVPYAATGVLLNPYKTSGSANSKTPFDQITLQSASALPITNRRDVIGYDWKTIDGYNSSGRYAVDRSKNYILYTRKNQVYKMHFLDFYNSDDIRGNPLFEYVQLR